MDIEGYGRDKAASLGSELPREIARVRDKILPAYRACGAELAATMMRRDLDAANAAMISGDTVEMLRIYRSLQGWAL